MEIHHLMHSDHKLRETAICTLISCELERFHMSLIYSFWGINCPQPLTGMGDRGVEWERFAVLSGN